MRSRSSGTTLRVMRMSSPYGRPVEQDTVLAAFGQWLDQRLGRTPCGWNMDLAFRDRPFDVEIGRTPVLVGWEHRYLRPGAPAPLRQAVDRLPPAGSGRPLRAAAQARRRLRRHR